MNFSEPFIRRPIATALLAIGILLAGALAFTALPVASVPSSPVPGIVVFASDPGAEPATMASTVAEPLEQTLGVIPGVQEVRSVNSTGSSSIVMLFDTGTDIAADAHAVQAAIDAALPNLPSGMPSLPYYRVFNPAARPVLTMFLSSHTMPLRDVYDFANTVIVQMISQVDGVAQVDLYGGESPAVRIRFDPHALAAAGLTPNDIYNAIRNANVTAPLGMIQGPESGSILAINGQLTTAAQYRQIVLKSSPTGVLRLGDVASVIDSVSNTQVSATDGTNPGIVVSVTKTASANVLQTVQGIKQRLPEIARYLPASVHLRVLTDRTTTIRASVADIEVTLLITIVLVLLVVTVFMRRVTPTIAAAITVPLSIAGTLAAMWARGFSLDNFSLLALTISVSFVVDDAIVMIENIVSCHERGLSGMEAAIVGARQIGFTVLSITVSLIVVFLPLTLMGGIIGGLFNEFALTLSISIAISGLVSLSVTPMICAHFMGRTPKLGRDSRPARAIDRMYRGTIDAYARSLDWALAHRWLTLTIFLLTIALTVLLYIEVPKTFIPEDDTGLITAHTIASSDVSFDQMQRLQESVVKVVKANPAVDTLSSRIGVTNGFSTANRGNLIICLKPLADRAVSAQQVIVQLREQLAPIAGISTYMQVEQDLHFGGQSNGGEYSFSVLDPSLSSLEDVVNRIEARLRLLKSISNISSDQDKAETQITVTIDRDAAARLGVTVAAIDTALGNAFAQRQISRIYQAQNQYSVV
ncbi:MAG: efflux RND transporter permease subunit, partial [Solirubrobacteraceae bacterium]